VSNWVPGLVGTAVRYVSIPSFSRLAEETPKTLALGVQRAIPLMVSVVVPVAVTMAVLGPAMIRFLYGARWVPAGTVLRFLAVVMLARMLTALTFDILTSMGITRATVWLNLVWAAVLIPSLIAGVHLDGIRGAAIAHAIVAMVVAIPCALVALRLGGINLRPIGPALVRPLLGGLLAGLIMLGVSNLFEFPPAVELFAAGGAGFIAYLLVAIRPRQFSKLIASARRGEIQA
jgi:O-antigen/teichoic acid export membrane protein